MKILTSEMVILRSQAAGRFDAIRQAGEVLVKAGCVPAAYIDGMLAREKVQSTYLGSGIALPHGQGSDLPLVLRAGISVVQLPEGVEWDPGERAYLVIGLASAGMQHSEILSNLVELIQTPAAAQILVDATDPMVIVERLTRGRSETVWN